MNDAALHTIEQIEAFLTGTATVEFRFENTAAGYAWIQATLARFGYATLRRPHKGMVRPLSSGGDGVLPSTGHAPDPWLP